MRNPDSRTETGPFVVHDNDTIVYASRSVLPLLRSASRESVLGTSLRGYLSESSREAIADQFDQIEDGDASALGLTVTLNSSDDISSEVIAVSSPIRWNGRERIQTLFIEVTSNLPTGLSANTMDASPIGISIADASRDDLPLIYVNTQFTDLTGYSREEVLGRNCRFLQGEDTRDEPVERMRRAIENEEPVTVELRNYRKDGSMFWNRVSIRPVTDDTGEVTHFLGFQEDISARKVYEQEKTLFEMQAESIDKSVFITDVDGTIEYVNPQFERTTGYTASEAIGNTPRILKSGAQDDSFYQELWETITAGEVWEATITNKRKNGERYAVEQKIVPITDGKGEITHFVSIEDDISDSEFIEEVLEVMNRVLRHNVRNSVNAIDGYAEMLEQGETDPSDQAALQTIRDHAATLEKLSDRAREIRELFRRRHESHTLAVESITDIVRRQQDSHPDAQIDLTIATDADAIQNGGLLQIAIDEAIENAVIHNDQERPHVAVTVTDVPDADELSVEIADDGPGIPDSEWDVIFSGRETPLSHGSGIGLWLMYWTLTALGGTLERTDNDPRGTVITYRVPTGIGDHVDAWNSPVFG